MHDETDREPAKKRGRPAKRQRRNPNRDARNSQHVLGKNLAVRKDLLNFNEFSYRWINDAPAARFRSKLVNEEWAIVNQDGGEIKEDVSDLGSAISMAVGTAKDGQPMTAYLCCKPKEFFDEDSAAKQRELDEQLAQLKAGNNADGSQKSGYVPSEGISISSG